MVGLNLPELNYPCVEADHYFNAELACMKLIAKKCKRIGFIQGRISFGERQFATGHRKPHSVGQKTA